MKIANLLVIALSAGLALAVAACGSSSSGSSGGVSVAYINPYTGNNFQKPSNAGSAKRPKKPGTSTPSRAPTILARKRDPDCQRDGRLGTDAMVLAGDHRLEGAGGAAEAVKSAGTTVVVFGQPARRRIDPRRTGRLRQRRRGEVLGKTMVENWAGKGRFCRSA